VDNASTREGCVEQLRDSLLRKFMSRSIILTDNELPNTPLPQLTLLLSSTNDGYAQGNNKGLQLAYSDEELSHVLILNNDILFVEDIIPRLLEEEMNLSNNAFLSPLLLKKDRKSIDYNCARSNYTNWNLILTYLMWYKDLFGYITRYSRRMCVLLQNPCAQNLSYVPIELPSGSCMFINKSKMEEIGGFDPNTFLYFEENILFKKIQKRCWQNYLIPSIKCVHLGGQSTQRTNGWFTLSQQFHSSVYYLKHYGNMTLVQRFFLLICEWWFPIKIHLKKVLFKFNRVL